MRHPSYQSLAPWLEALEVRTVPSGGSLDGISGSTVAHTAKVPILAHPPALTPEELEILTNDGGEEDEQGDLEPPANQGNGDFGGTETLVSGVAPGTGNGPQSVGDFNLYQDTTVGSGTNGSTSEIGKPSIGSLGRAVFQTGNWYAAVSGDNGANFRYVSPYTAFPTSRLGAGGFCCDQRVATDLSPGMLLWYLQYSKTGSTASDTNGVRIAAVTSESDLLDGNWSYWDFDPASFGLGGDRWMDFPHMEVSANYLYCTSNVFGVTDGSFKGESSGVSPSINSPAAAGSVLLIGVRKTSVGPEPTLGPSAWWATLAPRCMPRRFTMPPPSMCSASRRRRPTSTGRTSPG